MLPAVVSDGIYFVIVRWHEQYKNANLGKSVILFSFGFCRKYFRFTVLIKALYFLQALVFIEHWIMPENITPVRLELWEHQPHHTWWICPLKYGPRARPYEAPQCGLTICRHKREEDGGLSRREKHFTFSYQSAGISGLQQIFNHNKSSSQVFKNTRLMSNTTPARLNLWLKPRRRENPSQIYIQRRTIWNCRKIRTNGTNPVLRKKQQYGYCYNNSLFFIANSICDAYIWSSIPVLLFCGINIFTAFNITALNTNVICMHILDGIISNI